MEMEMEVVKMREDGIVCFEKDKRIWLFIDSDELFNWWMKESGYADLKRFTLVTGYTKKDIIGETVTATFGVVLLAQEQAWWDTMDLDRLKAVMNERIFGWALSGAFLAFMGEAEFMVDVLNKLHLICSDKATALLSSKFANEEWYPASDTTGFLEDVSDSLSTDFDFDFDTKLYGDGIQYFM